MSLAVHTDTGPPSLVRLRKGTEDAPVFLFSGAGADPNELTHIALRARNPKAMIGVDFCRRDDEGRFPATVAAMAERSCLAIRELQSRGPYHLVGYSFGGLIALEVARLLRETGGDVAFLGMIDTRYDSRYWPTGIFFRSQARLIGRHLAGLFHLSPSAAFRNAVLSCTSSCHSILEAAEGALLNPHPRLEGWADLGGSTLFDGDGQISSKIL